MKRPLGDLDGFCRTSGKNTRIAGKIYAANVMDAGLVRKSKVFFKKSL